MPNSVIEQINKIQNSYSEKQVSNFQRLKSLNKKAVLPPKIFAYTFGSISSLVLGVGMCMCMEIILTALPFAFEIGIGVGLLGILAMSINYPVYKKILSRRKKKYSGEILSLSQQLLNEESKNDK